MGIIYDLYQNTMKQYKPCTVRGYGKDSGDTIKYLPQTVHGIKNKMRGKS